MQGTRTHDVDAVHAQMEHIKSFDQLSSYFMQAPVAIAVITRDYRFTVVNDRYLKTIARTRDELMNRMVFDVMPELRDQLKPLIDKVIVSGEGIQVNEYPIAHMINGKLQTDYYNFIYEPVKDGSGYVTGVFLTGYNVTAEVESKIQLQQSESQLRLVADAMPALLSYIDREERFQFANKWYEEWFGTSSEYVNGKSVIELLGEKAYTTISPYIIRVLAGERVSYELLVPYKTKGERYIHATYIPDIDTNRQVRGFYALVEDVTERKLVDEKIKQSESHFRKMADTVPATIWITNKDGYCTYLNKQWYELTGQTEEQALGFGWLNAIHPDDLEATKRAFLEANARQTEFHGIYRLRHADGAYRWVLDRARPCFDASGKFEGMTGSVIDVHQEKEAEEKIRISEAKYRSLFNTMEQGFAIIEVIFDEANNPKDYCFLEVNPVFGLQTGLENAMGKTARQLVPSLEQHWFDIYGKVALTGESIKFSQGSDTMGRWFDVYAFKVGGNESRRVALLFSDVSDRKRSEEQLKESEERFRALVTATSDVIYRMSPAWNEMRNLDERGFLSGTGESVKDWLQKYIHPQDHERVIHAIEHAIKTKSVFEMEHQVLRADGTFGWTFSRAIPVLDNQGNITEWFGAASDITERKHTAEALQESENRFRNLAMQLEKIVAERTQELQRSNEDLAKFAHVASHDLKEPVRKIKMFIDLLISEYGNTLPERALHYLSKIDKSCNRMNTMVEGVLQYSWMNALEQAKEQVNIETIIESIETDLELVITTKNAKLVRHNLPVITGSPILLYQLFYNLINNSLKFTKKDHDPEIRIYADAPTPEELKELNLDNTQQYIKLVVRDNGIGFKNEEAESIFGAFTRLHAKDQYEGTGLGLALCKNIALRHGGAMSAEGHEGKGATFNIFLPQQSDTKNI